MIFGYELANNYWNKGYKSNQNFLEEVGYRPLCLFFADVQKALHEV